MDLENINGFTLRGLSPINIILGKNGCGKSYLEKRIEQDLQNREGYGKVRYISPERGGLLKYEPGIDQNISQDPNWMLGQRRKNQSANFRQQSATLFRRLELLVLREIEREHVNAGYVPRSFDQTVELLNKLLDRVRLARDDTKAFKIVNRKGGDEAPPEELSSGESELISLGIEFLAFVKECVADKLNILLVDEPDVHLHPDLQDRLARFIVDAFKGQAVTLILATHSTALVASLAEADADARVAFMRQGDAVLTFNPVSDVDRAILPIFGAHPLSNIFNEAPVLLVEGEDDERIWQQAVRSSAGQIRIFPCVVDGLPRFVEFETEVNNIIEAVYDDARAYSLRDRDVHPEAIDDIGHIVRMRLRCRAAENLMLANETLAMVGVDWPALQQRITQWAAANTSHQYHADVQAFIDQGFDRKFHDLKTIRNILVGLFSNKPWEVIVGQAIAHLVQNDGPAEPDNLRDYLGPKLCVRMLKMKLRVPRRL